MLVLTRSEGETIVINEDIHVVILRSASRKVRVGIVAPEDVPVDRYEIFRRKLEQA